MKFVVRLTAKAEQDIDGILRWFQEQNALRASQRWLDSLLAGIKSLESNPLRCSPADEAQDLHAPLQELLLGKRRYRYRIIFQVRGHTVEILRIWHSSRDAIRPGDL